MGAERQRWQLLTGDASLNHSAILLFSIRALPTEENTNCLSNLILPGYSRV